MYEATRAEAAAAASATNEFPGLWIEALEDLFCPELALLLAAEATEVAVSGLRVELMTGEVGATLTVVVPTSTTKYMP
jgi:hypothetical protein